MRNNVSITFSIFLTDEQHLYANNNQKNVKVDKSFAVQWVMNVLRH